MSVNFVTSVDFLKRLLNIAGNQKFLNQNNLLACEGIFVCLSSIVDKWHILISVLFSFISYEVIKDHAINFATCRSITKVQYFHC